MRLLNMQCPRCSQDLIEVNKPGVVIDACTPCGGIWLDKGKLGKIISQIKEAEHAIDTEITPIFREKKEFYNKYSKYRYKKKSTFGKILDILN
jgi:Zn-finger nucleic acid-binding protein